LPVRESIGFVFVGIYTAELLAIRVKYCHQEMVMFASFIFVEISAFSLLGFFRRIFGHRGHPYFSWWVTRTTIAGKRHSRKYRYR